MDKIDDKLVKKLTKPYYVLHLLNLSVEGKKLWDDIYQNYASECFHNNLMPVERVPFRTKIIKQTKAFDKVRDSGEWDLKYWGTKLVKAHPERSIIPNFKLKDFDYELFKVTPTFEQI